ncbi:MAG: hypothetical protein JO303_13245, partial [Caulobacteraceae bacterium]|nr:hypothetical protein [Caulobacteraceae bacterium]
MTLHRRSLLASVPALLAGSAYAAGDMPIAWLAALSAYEQASGGRVGLLARNLAT